jgi:3-methylcrotonyl-CoA carboxylase alpha subunit
MKQHELGIEGWAMEARLYAEDPSKGFLPSVGKLDLAEFPDEVVRVETGVEEGDAISPYYDPMIAKLVATGADRTEAMMNLASALYGLRVWPLKTNAAFLLSCLQDPDFQAGEVTTGLIADRGEALAAAPVAGDNEWRVAAMQSFAPYYAPSESASAGPWVQNFGFRLNAADSVNVTLQHGGERRTIDLEAATDASGFSAPLAEGALVFKNGQPLEFKLGSRGTGTTHGLHDGEIEAPMPGKVTAVEVSQGEKVAKGQRLLTLEAMKMEHALTAPFDGTVAELNATAGSQVTEGQMLVKVEADQR